MSGTQQETLEKRGVWRDALSTIGVAVALVALFLTVPLSSRDGTPWWFVTIAIAAFMLFLLALSRTVIRGANLFRLLNLLLTVVTVFAFGFYTIAVNIPGEFDGIATRIDALYFTLTTMTTTGYGDIHATGQLARIVVSFALVFDVVFLGLVGAELSRLASDRHHRREMQS